VIHEPAEDLKHLKIEALSGLMQSEFKAIMFDHAEYLNSQALLKIDEKKFEEASILRARAKECMAILKLVDGRLAQLKKGE
jgi:hypothetical protein